MRDEPRTIGGALGAGIFFLPQIFGWKVLAPGYGVMTRIIVFTYMILSSIPLYFLIVTFWTSGGDIVSMAENYDKNRSTTERGIEEAKGYIDQYDRADLRSTGANPEGGSAAAPSADGVSVTATAMADAARSGATGLAPYRGRVVTVSGRVTGTTAGGVYLEGNDAYPAVLLRYETTAPGVSAGDQLTATCQDTLAGLAGPELSKCRP